MMDFFFYRQSFYGSPFCMLNSGRDSRDSQNKAKIHEALAKFRNSEEGQKLPSPYNTSSVTAARIALPIAGALFGRFMGDIYCAPSSIYLKGILTVAGAIFFNKIAIDIRGHNEVGYWTNNFASIPVDLQRALKSNDSRYAHQWTE